MTDGQTENVNYRKCFLFGGTYYGITNSEYLKACSKFQTALANLKIISHIIPFTDLYILHSYIVKDSHLKGSDFYPKISKLSKNMKIFAQRPCFVGPLSTASPFSGSYVNLLKTKRRRLYLKTQFVPRSKHFSSRL